MRGMACALLVALVLARLACASLQCAQRREISPCSCRRQEGGSTGGTLILMCERVPSFASIKQAVGGRFSPGTTVRLNIAYSDVRDLGETSIKELGLDVNTLKLNFNNISVLSEAAFQGLYSTKYLSLADNFLSAVPLHVLRHMPKIRTLDLGRNQIKILGVNDFRDVPEMDHLIIPGNGIKVMEQNSLPDNLKKVHIGLNLLSSLNGTLRKMQEIEWLFINENKLTSIDNELPMNAYKMLMLNAEKNQLERLPMELRQMQRIENLFFEYNNIKSLNNIFQKARRLQKLQISFNKINHLAHDEFLEADSLQVLDLGYNQIQSLNGSLTYLKSLVTANLTHNKLTEFSLQEIKGLKSLYFVDLSHNKITHLSGHTENLVELETKVMELKLDHNRLHNLGGALMGLHGLIRLNISYNQLEIISPDDLIGLDKLRHLDVSHNRITTLEETSKTYLPALEELIATNNNITYLDKDFHGLPVLCEADLSHNYIKSINHDLVTKTRCSILGVSGTLKIYLFDNPVLCDKHFPDLISRVTEHNSRFLGECTRRKMPATNSPSMLAPPPLMNDVIPPAAGSLRPIISVIPLESPLNPQSNLLETRDIVEKIIAGRSEDLPIIVEEPITLSTEMKSVQPVNMAEAFYYKEPIDMEAEPDNVPEAIPSRMT